METEKKEGFKIMGISVRTGNANGQAAKDIPELWRQWMAENVMEKIPGKINQEVYAIYTNYEGDFMMPYDCIIGCKVKSLDHIPEGLIGQEFAGGNYKKYVSKGDLTQGVVINTWKEIWNTKLDRAYTADLEIYGERAKNAGNAEVDIYIALN